MTYQLYDEFIRAARDFPLATSEELAKGEISRLKETIKQLPKPNYDTLKFLILHLKRYFTRNNKVVNVNFFDELFALKAHLVSGGQPNELSKFGNCLWTNAIVAKV